MSRADLKLIPNKRHESPDKLRFSCFFSSGFGKDITDRFGAKWSGDLRGGEGCLLTTP